MIYLKVFITIMEKAAESDPMMQRWLQGTKELRRLMAERIIRLSLYPDLMPDEILLLYANTLLEILKEENPEYLSAIIDPEVSYALIGFTQRLEKQNAYYGKQAGQQIIALLEKIT